MFWAFGISSGMQRVQHMFRTWKEICTWIGCHVTEAVIRKSLMYDKSKNLFLQWYNHTVVVIVRCSRKMVSKKVSKTNEKHLRRSSFPVKLLADCLVLRWVWRSPPLPFFWGAAQIGFEVVILRHSGGRLFPKAPVMPNWVLAFI